MTQRIHVAALDPHGNLPGKVPVIDPTGAFVEWATVSGGGGGGAILAALKYSPATASNKQVTGAALTAIDTTNLSITFTATSDKALVYLSAFSNGVTNTSFDSAIWGLVTTSGARVASKRVVNGGEGGTVTIAFLVTGLTPGTSYTYRWAMCCTVAGNTCQIQVGGVSAPDELPALMWVEDAGQGGAATTTGDIDGGTWDSTYLDFIDGGSF